MSIIIFFSSNDLRLYTELRFCSYLFRPLTCVDTAISTSTHSQTLIMQCGQIHLPTYTQNNKNCEKKTLFTCSRWISSFSTFYHMLLLPLPPSHLCHVLRSVCSCTRSWYLLWKPSEKVEHKGLRFSARAQHELCDKKKLKTRTTE